MNEKNEFESPNCSLQSLESSAIGGATTEKDIFPNVSLRNSDRPWSGEEGISSFHLVSKSLSKDE